MVVCECNKNVGDIIMDNIVKSEIFGAMLTDTM
jgi:hypothetical protein